MNRLLSPLGGLIDLALEGPFQLGRLEVRPAALELRGEDGVAQSLEPRVMQVLVALHHARGEAVSRDELSRLCWDGRIVGVDALNRCVSQLRKALLVEPQVMIDTIPKIGYRLRRLPPGEVARPSASIVDAPRRRPRARASLIVGLGLAAAAAVGAAFWLMRPVQWSANAVTPLTREAGMETYPALSPDGRLLVYAAAPGLGAPRDLFLRSAEVGDSPPLRLTAGPGDEVSPVWSPDGRRVAFVRQVAGQPCAVVMMTPPQGQERVVGRCRTDSFSTLAWPTANEMVFTDRDAAGGVRRLFRLDVASGQPRALSRPADGTTGDSAPMASPDGRKIAFRRTAALGVDDLQMIDLRTERETPLTREGWKAIGFAWSADARTLFLTSNRGGDFGLWAVDTARPGPLSRVTLGLLPFGRLSSDRQGRLAAEVSRLRTNLAVWREGDEPAALTASTGADWDPDVGPDGAVAFGSDQSGSNEIWVRRRNAEPARLTALSASYVYAPRWSPDGRRIAFLAARDRASHLYLMNADGSALRRLSVEGAPKGDVVWLDDQTLAYSWREGRRWRLSRIDMAGAVAPLAGEGFALLRRGPDGGVYATRPGDARLWLLTPGASRLVEPQIRLGDAEAWAPAAEGVYWVQDRYGPAPSLWLSPWRGTPRRVTALAPATKLTVAVDHRSGAVVAPRTLRDDADLVRLDVTRSRPF